MIDSFRLNLNGRLNKIGENIIYNDDIEIVKFGVREIYSGILHLGGGFLSLYPRRGYGSASISFLFHKLPKINTIRLQCKDHILPFWRRVGGQVIDRADYNIVDIYRFC